MPRTLIAPDEIKPSKFEGLRIYQGPQPSFAVLLFSDNTACLLQAGDNEQWSRIEPMLEIRSWELDLAGQVELGLMTMQERLVAEAMEAMPYVKNPNPWK